MNHQYISEFENYNQSNNFYEDNNIPSDQNSTQIDDAILQKNTLVKSNPNQGIYQQLFYSMFEKFKIPDVTVNLNKILDNILLFTYASSMSVGLTLFVSVRYFPLSARNRLLIGHVTNLTFLGLFATTYCFGGVMYLKNWATNNWDQIKSITIKTIIPAVITGLIVAGLYNYDTKCIMKTIRCN